MPYRSQEPLGFVALRRLLTRKAGCLQVLQEMLDMLRDHSNNAHSARLEWCAGGFYWIPCLLFQHFPSIHNWGLGSLPFTSLTLPGSRVGMGVGEICGVFQPLMASSEQTLSGTAPVRRIVIGLIVVALIIAIYQFVGVEMLGIGKAGHHHPGHHPPPPPLHGGARPSHCPAAASVMPLPEMLLDVYKRLDSLGASAAQSHPVRRGDRAIVLVLQRRVATVLSGLNKGVPHS